MSELLKLPYAERRVIVIKPSDESDEAASTVDWKAASAAGVVAVGVVSIAALAVTPLFNPSGGIVYNVLKEGVRSLLKRPAGKRDRPEPSSEPALSPAPSPIRAPKSRLSGVRAVDHDSAVNSLQFPPGHPLFDHAYVGHPRVPARYIPSAVFHPTLFEEKVNELVTLLASLGATWVRVVCHKGYRQGGGGRAEVGGVGGLGKAGIAGSAEQGSQQTAVFEEHFRPTGEPFIPDDLVWLGDEHSWLSLARRRLNLGTTKFRVSLNYQDDYGVNADLKATLQGFGFKLGGEFSRFESTSWEFEGEFA